MQKIAPFLAPFLAAAALAGFAAGAAAQDAGQGFTSDHVAAMDPNKDGAVDKPEYEKFLDVTFVTLDANKDGRLNWSETQEIIPRAVFGTADANADDALSRAEFDAQVERDFLAADRDGNGVLD